MIPKIHAGFKVGGLLVGIATIAAQIAAIGGVLPHPTPIESDILNAATGVCLVLAAFGVHPGDSTTAK